MKTKNPKKTERRRLLILIIVLTTVSMAGGTTLVVLPGEACVQEDFRAYVPFALDPNLAALGAVLGPVPHDPNVWTIPFGQFNRRLQPCDPDGDPTEVTLVATNGDGSVIVHDPNADTWTLTAEVLPGLRWWHVRVTDRGDTIEPMSRDVVIVCLVERRANHPPVLARAIQRKLQRLQQKKLVAWGKREGLRRRRPVSLTGPEAHAFLAGLM